MVRSNAQRGLVHGFTRQSGRKRHKHFLNYCISTDSLVDRVQSILIQLLYSVMLFDCGVASSLKSFHPDHLKTCTEVEGTSLILPEAGGDLLVGGPIATQTSMGQGQGETTMPKATLDICRWDFVHLLWPGGSKTEVMTLIQEFEACIVRSLPVLLQIRPAASVASTHTLWLSQCWVIIYKILSIHPGSEINTNTNKAS